MKSLTLLVLATVPFLVDCTIAVNCPGRTMTVNGKGYPVVCASWTARNMNGGVLGSVFRANGKWRPGLVPVGTPMIGTSPRLCDDCWFHVGYGAKSNGCIGTTGAGFAALSHCAGSGFTIKGGT